MFLFVVALACWVAGCKATLPLGGNAKSAEERSAAAKYFPAEFVVQNRATGEPRVAKVRVWADEEYRAQNLGWQHKFGDELDQANQILLPMLGVRLEAEYRSWDHHAPTDGLHDHLAALEAFDTGDDVVWIIGLTSSLSLVSATFEQVGVAEVGGRHVMLRGYNEVEERKALDAALSELGANAQAALFEARRHHKMTTVLVHEMAHSLGALHESGPDAVMSAVYSHHASSIGARNREVMAVTLDERLGPGAHEPAPAARAMVAGRPNPRPAVIAAASSRAGSDSIVAQCRRVEQLIERGDLDGASSELEPLIAAYPAHSQPRLLRCRIELKRNATAVATRAACERAAAASDEIAPALEVALAQTAAGDAEGARASVAAGEARLAKLPHDEASAKWLMLAEYYRKTDALSAAERAVANAGLGHGPDHEIAAWAAARRVRYGIPRDGAAWKLSPDNDAEAIAAVIDVLARVYANKFDAANRAAAAAERRWPGLPGLLAARCDLEFRRGDIAAARRLCERARKDDLSSWAIYLSGIIELRGGSPAAIQRGIERLRSAIALDPALGQAWRSLDKALARTNASAERVQLHNAYRARFGESL